MQNFYNQWDRTLSALEESSSFLRKREKEETKKHIKKLAENLSSESFLGFKKSNTTLFFNKSRIKVCVTKGVSKS